MKADGYVLFAIPAKNGWSIAVDGQSAEVVRGDFGLIATRVAQGDHDIELTYMSPGLREGAVVSVCAITVVTAWLLRCRKRETR